MPGPRVIPVQGDETLPKHVDTVVIGGGIIGCAIALELVERGQRVALCEKGGIGQEQSSRNWGWVRLSRRDAREIPLMIEALKLWPKLDKRTGRDLGYRRTGIAFACHNEAEIARCEAWAERLAPYKIDSCVLSGARLAADLPGITELPKAALVTPIDGQAEPQKAAPALAEAARERGATLLTECAVRGLETTAGRVSAVVTERGPISCDAAVLAGGAWSRLFSGNTGIDLPQLKVANTVLRTAPGVDGPEMVFWNDALALRKRQDGGYTLANGTVNHVDIVPDSFRLGLRYMPALRHEWHHLRLRLGLRFAIEADTDRHWSLDEPSPFEYTRVLDPKPHSGLVARIQSAAAKLFPAFAQAKTLQSWAGLIDVTPDAVPVIGPVEQISGFFIATGFSGHGFGIGPGAGRLTAELVTGVEPCVDPTPFRLSRFSDGSKIVVDCAV